MNLCAFIRPAVAAVCLGIASGAFAIGETGTVYFVDRYQPADIPGPKLDRPYLDASAKIFAGFAKAHTRSLRWINNGITPAAGLNTELVFFGDSITARWRTLYPEHFRATWQPYSVLNLGIGGDKIQHVLWRVTNGAFPATLQAKVVVLMIGTNNATDNNTDANKLAGIAAIISKLKAEHPSTQVLLLGILPRKGRLADAQTKRMNTGLATMHNPAEGIHFLNMRQAFTNADDTLNKALYAADELHPNLEGYDVFANQTREKVAELMQVMQVMQ